jgi:Zn-finger nucleic acid-binding protein
MICPTCREVMIVVEQDKIELDHCPQCSGVWFDAGELELMLERMGLDGGALSLAKILGPVCGQKMV